LSSFTPCAASSAHTALASSTSMVSSAREPPGAATGTGSISVGALDTRSRLMIRFDIFTTAEASSSQVTSRPKTSV
jgi:hypothetical protein